MRPDRKAVEELANANVKRLVERLRYADHLEEAMILEKDVVMTGDGVRVFVDGENVIIKMGIFVRAVMKPDQARLLLDSIQMALDVLDPKGPKQ